MPSCGATVDIDTWDLRLDLVFLRMDASGGPLVGKETVGVDIRLSDHLFEN